MSPPIPSPDMHLTESEQVDLLALLGLLVATGEAMFDPRNTSHADIDRVFGEKAVFFAEFVDRAHRFIDELAARRGLNGPVQ